MEAEFLKWLGERVASDRRLMVGIGDDAAVLQGLTDGRCVVTSDLLTDGVDFILARCDARLVGRKALAVNLSDLAAMAARPTAAFISLVVPREGGLELAQRLYEGLLPLAEEYEIAVAGGDTNSWDGPLAISVTAIGEVTGRGPLTRSGAKPGDAILVTGSFGGSILGKHFSFTPRVREALYLHEHYDLHACTDVSDGLSLDLHHILESSRCGAEIAANRIPLADDAVRLAGSSGDQRSALEHALTDGEDFELIITAAPDTAAELQRATAIGTPITCIGRIVEQRGLWLVGDDGTREPCSPQGFEH